MLYKWIKGSAREAILPVGKADQLIVLEILGRNPMLTVEEACAAATVDGRCEQKQPCGSASVPNNYRSGK